METVISAPYYRHSRLALSSFPRLSTVIPAQAGIQAGNAKDRHTANRSFLDSRLRGNDGRARREGRQAIWPAYKIALKLLLGRY